MTNRLMLSILCLVFFAFQMNAQQDSKEVKKEKEVKEVKEVKKVVKVIKTVDENGKETVRTIETEIEGDPIVIDSKDSEINVEVEVKIDEDGKKNVWITKDGKKIEVDAADHNIHKQFKIISIDDDGKENKWEWNGDGEMPEEMKKALEKSKIKFNSDGHNMFIYESDSEDNSEIEVNKKLIKITADKIFYNAEDKNQNKAMLGVHIENTDGGVLINKVIEETGAMNAGLAEGDVIQKVNGKEVSDINQLVEVLSAFNVGDVVKIELLRDNATMVKDVTLSERKIEKVEEIIIGTNCDENMTGDDELNFIFKTEDGAEIKGAKIFVIKTDDSKVVVETEIEEIVEGVELKETEVAEELEETATEKAPLEIPDNLGKLKLKNFKVFPNPSNDVLNINFNGKDKPMIVQLMSATGQEMFKENLGNFDGNYNRQLNVSDYIPGTYYLYIIQDAKVHVETITVN